MTNPFLLILLGFILVFVDVHLFFFDILADPVGYILIMSGAQFFSEQFNKAFILMVSSFVLIFLSISAIVSLSIIGFALSIWFFVLIYRFKVDMDDDINSVDHILSTNSDNY
ncbi:hypothetical protein [Halalkalibacillus halophilus]|uniref:hypothetical protein n=1 Tax=Halalkalibacillus halophilus TaxID=392827 RepID=UPI000427D5F7|nr:hypothetical protein [Halalkalibacillus halophilus]